MFARIIDPTRQSLGRCHGAGWIVGETEVDHIDVLLRRIGHEIIFDGARQIGDSFVATVVPHLSGMTSHDIGIDVNWINRIGDRDFVLMSKNIQDVTAIAFRSVRHENLILTDLDATVAIVRLGDFASQELVALFRAVAAKGFAGTKLSHRLLHRGDGSLRQRLGHVANSAPN